MGGGQSASPSNHNFTEQEWGDGGAEGGERFLVRWREDGAVTFTSATSPDLRVGGAGETKLGAGGATVDVKFGEMAVVDLCHGGKRYGCFVLMRRGQMADLVVGPKGANFALHVY